MDERHCEDTCIPLTLRERYLQREVVLFVGSGLSRMAGAPGWKDLLSGLLSRFKEEMITVPYEKEVGALIEKGNPSDFLWVVEYLRSIKKGLIADHVREVCGHLPPQTLHRLIAKLECPGVVTTNFDDLVESAVSYEKGKVNVILPQNLEGLAKLKERSPWVLKLHGTFQDSAGAILSLTDYEELAAKPSVTATLGWLLQRYTILFLGFGLRDPDMLDQFSFLRFVFHEYQRTHYALMEERSIEDFRAKVLDDVYNIQIIKYSKSQESHPEVAGFLMKLLKCEPGEGRLSLPILLFVVTKITTSGGDGTMLLVKKPYPDAGSEEAKMSARPYLLPSLTDIGYSEDQLVEAGLRYMSRCFKWFKKEHFRLKLDREVFKSKKLSPSLGEEVPHEIRFAQVELNAEVLERMGEEVRLGGHIFEWQHICKLRNHPPTAKLNGDVIEEVCRRVKA